MQNKSLFAFTRINFILLGVALLIIVVGFVLMSGPGSTDTHFEPSIFDQTSHRCGTDGLLCGAICL